MLMPRACDNSLFHRFFFSTHLTSRTRRHGVCLIFGGEGVDGTDTECDTRTFPGENGGETDALPHPTQMVATATLRVMELGA